MAGLERLDAARMQLSAALDSLGNRMEQASSLRSSAMEPMRDMAEAEALRNERDRLLGRLAELEKESHALGHVTQEVESRLDDAIAEIREVLELVA